MTEFTFDELRRAVKAMDVIEQRGDRDDWAYILKQAQNTVPSAGLWGNASIGTRAAGEALARRVADLLGESRDRCEQAAAEVLAPQRGRVVYDALMGYAGELTGYTRRESHTTPRPIQRPAVRIVANREGAA